MINELHLELERSVSSTQLFALILVRYLEHGKMTDTLEQFQAWIEEEHRKVMERVECSLK